MTDTQKRPKHVAVVMDGNGRWATEQGKVRTDGHLAGARRAREVIQAALDSGVRNLTLFGFSTENWKRPQNEIHVIMQQFRNYVNVREIANLKKKGVAVRFVGNREKLDVKLVKAMELMEHSTQTGDQLFLQIAISYGGQDEILRAANKLCLERKDSDEPISKSDFARALDTHGSPEVELCIRTGGETRISNFLLWQIAYAEIRFVDTLWPDYTTQDFQEDLDWYMKRQRRFGTVPIAAE